MSAIEVTRGECLRAQGAWFKARPDHQYNAENGV